MLRPLASSIAERVADASRVRAFKNCAVGRPRPTCSFNRLTGCSRSPGLVTGTPIALSLRCTLSTPSRASQFQIELVQRSLDLPLGL